MVRTVQELASYRVGDLITLSDLQTQIEASDLAKEFPITQVRKYRHPEGIFEHTGYLIDGPEDVTYMVLVKTVGQNHEIYVYYIDTEGRLYEAEEGDEECPLWGLFDENQDELLERIEACVQFGDGEEDYRDVSWDKQDVFNGVVIDDGETEGVCCLGEYYTGDENDGNNYCLLDVRGNTDDGYIEVWYGTPIKDHEIDFLRIER